MNKYTIYCTEEQTKKALQLGAPIESYPIMLAPHGVPRYERQINKGWIAFPCPTVEKMRGWLEEQGIFIDIHFCGIRLYVGIKTETGYIGQRLKIDSRKETITFAIDVALEYLTNKINLDCYDFAYRHHKTGLA